MFSFSIPTKPGFSKPDCPGSVVGVGVGVGIEVGVGVEVGVSVNTGSGGAETTRRSSGAILAPPV